MKLVVLYILAMPLVVLGFAGVVGAAGHGRDVSILNPGAHGLTEVALRLHLGANNNGSAFGGLTGNTRLVQHDARPRDAGRPLLPRSSRSLAIAGSLARKQPVPAIGRHLPDRTPLFAGLLVGVIVIVVGLTFFPVLALGPDRRAPGSCDQRKTARHRMFEPGDRPATQRVDAFRKLDPRTIVRNPVMFVVEVGSVARHDPLRPRPRRASAAARTSSPGSSRVWLWFTVLFANFAEAMAEGRGKAQAATLRKTRAETHRPRAGATTARSSRCRASQLAARRRRRRHGRRGDPRRRRHRRGHRHGRRVGDHRRVGAGHPRVGRRPLGGHRRHPGALRPDRRAHHGQARARRSSTG